VAVIPEMDEDADFAGDRRVRLVERSAAIAVGTIAKLLGEHDLGELPAARRGIVLGSAMASIHSFMDISRTSLAGAKPYFVNHNRMPAAIMNYASGQAAIRFDLRGPNVTVTSGRASGVTALSYGRLLIGAGRADAIVCGAFEEVTPRRLRIEAAAGRLSASNPPGEGCCAFLLETAESAAAAGRPALAELLASSTALFEDPQDAGAALTKLVTRVLRQAGLSTGAIGLVVRGPGDGTLAEQETTALATLAPGVPILDPATSIGDTYGASTGFGVAAAIVDGPRKDRPTAVTLVTSIDPDGQLAAAIVRPVRTPGARS
jgi:3-oxoacyl-[acyl-carrier-protein] synthase II